MAQLAEESLDVLRPYSVIALACDDPVQAGAILDRFDEEGYETLLWNWGAGLHQMARRAQPALIILDCDTKRGKGLEIILRRMRRDPGTNRIPILFCTGVGSLPAVPLHRDRVIRKPYCLDDLCTRVEAVIGAPRRLHRRYRRRTATARVPVAAET